MDRSTGSTVRRLRRHGFVASLVALFTLLVPAVAHAGANANVRYTSPPYDAAIHEIRESRSRQCLFIRGASTNTGAVIQTFDRKGRHHQRFDSPASSRPPPAAASSPRRPGVCRRHPRTPPHGRGRFPAGATVPSHIPGTQVHIRG
ncbi:hypothetical protein OG393_32185 [Streptomyces sp. NBC_01216]|uniref:hypothetical protein n=1 Tax=Streptomyces sp. NBC_01216 TaxID=2903778 RepID=UPI002E1655E3|nr:hypothetical protein OG393_32185 [Streptomyces sp. NBC_01216]